MALGFITSREKIQDAVTEQTGLSMNFWQIDVVPTKGKKMIEDLICHDLIQDVKRNAVIGC